jgi:chorismate dehydratase
MILQLDNPAQCAEKLKKGDVDLGLIPVAVIPEIEGAQIISNYCIGAEGPVESVCLFSDVPVEDIENIVLDYQSRTSVQLVQYLAENLWKIEPNWIAADEDFISKIKGKTAGVVIGDRAFPLIEKFSVVKDLSEEWQTETGLPFVFACWVSNGDLDAGFRKSFEEALQFGLKNKQMAIDQYAGSDHANLVRYVESVISYDLDEKKRQAMKLFLDWLSKRT